MKQSRHDMRAAAAKSGRFGAVGVSFALVLSGCANQTAVQHYAHGNEYFSQKKYGHASPKMIADGQPVPKGGGQYLVGHPYQVAGRTYVPSEMRSYTAVGMASWYGAAFHGRRTANGEIYDMGSVTAAHPTMPLPSYARVTNLSNGYSVIVRVNDRGPYHGGRVMDVSSRAADVLDFKGEGTARVKVDYVGPAPLEGSDDATLLASLRTDGSAAHIDGIAEPVMVADNPPATGPSIFATLFGRHESTTPPGPPPAPVAPPPPPPEAIQVADAEPAPPHEPVRPPAANALRQPHEAVPLPPARPFDLGQAHGPAVFAMSSLEKSSPAISSLEKSSAANHSSEVAPVLPPRRPDLQASAEKALYFSDPSSERVRRLNHGAFERVKPAEDAANGD